MIEVVFWSVCMLKGPTLSPLSYGVCLTDLNFRLGPSLSGPHYPPKLLQVREMELLKLLLCLVEAESCLWGPFPGYPMLQAI